MTDYTPTTLMIQGAYVQLHSGRSWESKQSRHDEFIRWLEEVRREAKAGAWEEGRAAGMELGMSIAETVMEIKPPPFPSVPDNPYRQEEK